MEALRSYTQMIEKVKHGMKGNKLDKELLANPAERKIKVHQAVPNMIKSTQKQKYSTNTSNSGKNSSFSEPVQHNGKNADMSFSTSLMNYFKKQCIEEADELMMAGNFDNDKSKSRNATNILSLLKKPRSINAFVQSSLSPALNCLPREAVSVNYIKKHRNQWKSKFPSDYSSADSCSFGSVKAKRNSYNEHRSLKHTVLDPLYKPVMRSYRNGNDFPIHSLVKRSEAKDSYANASWSPYLKTHLKSLLQTPVRDRARALSLWRKGQMLKRSFDKSVFLKP
eukprot:TRINITY_DN16628_c0_g1_i1.p1 TRINITY_DN16628_c0_g1~~TRINITY_DN16628_c0_g1_i1.p1  ORF type:complete len:281 (-),score=49.52 TRINITY_DN16628_c0_g1_i1:145-987(-)